MQETELVVAVWLAEQLRVDDFKEEAGQIQGLWEEQDKAFLAWAESESFSDGLTGLFG